MDHDAFFKIPPARSHGLSDEGSWSPRWKSWSLRVEILVSRMRALGSSSEGSRFLCVSASSKDLCDLACPALEVMATIRISSRVPAGIGEDPSPRPCAGYRAPWPARYTWITLLPSCAYFNVGKAKDYYAIISGFSQLNLSIQKWCP